MQKAMVETLLVEKVWKLYSKHSPRFLNNFQRWITKHCDWVKENAGASRPSWFRLICTLWWVLLLRYHEQITQINFFNFSRSKLVIWDCWNFSFCSAGNSLGVQMRVSHILRQVFVSHCQKNWRSTLSCFRKHSYLLYWLLVGYGIMVFWDNHSSFRFLQNAIS